MLEKNVIRCLKTIYLKVGSYRLYSAPELVSQFLNVLIESSELKTVSGILFEVEIFLYLAIKGETI